MKVLTVYRNLQKISGDGREFRESFEEPQSPPRSTLVAPSLVRVEVELQGDKINSCIYWSIGNDLSQKALKTVLTNILMIIITKESKPVQPI